MSWKVYLSKKAVKDSKKLKSAGLKPQAERLLGILSEDPFQSPPDFEKTELNKIFFIHNI